MTGRITVGQGAGAFIMTVGVPGVDRVVSADPMVETVPETDAVAWRGNHTTMTIVTEKNGDRADRLGGTLGKDQPTSTIVIVMMESQMTFLETKADREPNKIEFPEIPEAKQYRAYRQLRYKIVEEAAGRGDNAAMR